MIFHIWQRCWVSREIIANPGFGVFFQRVNNKLNSNRDKTRLDVARGFLVQWKCKEWQCLWAALYLRFDCCLLGRLRTHGAILICITEVPLCVLSQTTQVVYQICVGVRSNEGKRGSQRHTPKAKCCHAGGGEVYNEAQERAEAILFWISIRSPNWSWVLQWNNNTLL